MYVWVYIYYCRWWNLFLVLNCFNYEVWFIFNENGKWLIFREELRWKIKFVGVLKFFIIILYGSKVEFVLFRVGVNGNLKKKYKDKNFEIIYNIVLLINIIYFFIINIMVL